MTDEQLIFLGIAVFVAMIAVIVICVVWELRKNKDKYKQEIEDHIENKFSEEAEVMAFHAEIADMVCGSGMVGSYRLPKSVKTFLVIFKNDEGDVLDISVSEEVYLSLEKGMSGMLTIVEGNLDSFELDEV